MPPSPTDRSPTAQRALWWMLLGCSLAAAGVFVFAVSQRLAYPYELEWMEGAMVDHSSRVANGLPIYCEPGPEHVPFLYAPMLFWLGGLLMKVGLPGLFALRLVATAATIGCALLIGHWVRRATGGVAPGLVASGVFFAGYGWLAWWYDLARNDGLFVLLCLGTAYVLRYGGARRWLVAAGLATAAVLAKQSALIWLPAIGVGALCHDWRVAVRFAVATLAGVGITTGAMHLASDGWSTFYLFEMPRHHGWNGDRKLGFWTEDLLPMLPLVGLGLLGFVAQWRSGARREALFLGAFGSGGLMTSWFSRLHVGGFDNVLLYGFAGACVLGPVAAASLSTAAGARWQQLAAPVLLLVQFAWLGEAAWQRDPGTTLLPSAAHRRAHEELFAFVQAQPGPVWIPGHGGISLRAGKGTGAHGQAIFDLLQLLPRAPDGSLDLSALVDREKLGDLSPRGRAAITIWADRTGAALMERRFAAIVADLFGSPPVDAWGGLYAYLVAGAGGHAGTGDDPYVRRPGALLTDPRAIDPLLGYEVHSPYVMLPRR
ncbi:MAG TPA: hypothetical protein VFZ65_02115 [Planctomycetota bacterium]|nr:hypothetical protein [Planctomycetota bacterium]